MLSRHYIFVTHRTLIKIRRHSREFKALLASHVLIDDRFRLHGITFEDCRLLHVLRSLRECKVLVVEQIGISVGIRFDDNFSRVKYAEDDAEGDQVDELLRE